MATHDYEKSSERGVDTLEKLDKSDTTDSDRLNDERINAFTPEEQRKIIRRIDYRLVITLGLMYCVSLMDRTNLGIWRFIQLSLFDC
jgi:hypothetical protein